MKHRITLTAMLLMLCLFAIAGSGGHKRKVLIIGIDGCRADALKLEMDSGHAPNISNLAANGFYTVDAWHLDITISGPSWSSIMCGVYHPKHGVTNNTYSGSHYNQYPYFPTHAKEIDSTFKCVQYTEWAPMSQSVYNDGWDQKIIGTDGYSQGTGAAAAGLIQDPATDVLFTYFDKVDLTGHSSGFSPNNPAYMQAIDSIDVQVGKIMQALRSRPTYSQEDWLVLLTTDHGGTGTGHGGISYEERNIWWIGYSDRGVHRRITAQADPGTYLLYPLPNIVDTAKQHLSPVQVDIATTALHHLIYNSGIRPENQAAWELDGKSWLCEMGLCDSLTTGLADVAAQADIRVVPNPSADGRFMVSCDGYDGDITLDVVDGLGRAIKHETLRSSTRIYQLDMAGEAKGVYHLSLRSAGRAATRNIVIE